jgi:hypothetical protein
VTASTPTRTEAVDLVRPEPPTALDTGHGGCRHDRERKVRRHERWGVSPGRLDRDRLHVASIVAANAVPLGVLLAGGRLVVVAAVLYWLEAGVRMGRGLVAGLFAAYRETEGVRTALELTLTLPAGADFESMRGSFDLGDRLPPVNACNLRLFATYLPVVLALLLPGCFAVGLSADDVLFGPVGTPVVLVGGLCLVARHWLGLSRTYLATGAHEETSNHAMLPTLRLAAVTAVLTPLLVWLVTAPYPEGLLDGRTPAAVRSNFALLLLVVGAVKLALELRNHRRSRARRFESDGSDTVRAEVFGRFTATAATPPAPVASPSGTPWTVLDTHRGRLRLRSLGFSLILAPLTVGAGATVGFLVWVFFGTAAGVGVGALVVALFVSFEFVGVELDGGAVEYRVYEGGLVAYDRRLDAAQWRVDAGAVTDYTVSASIWDRLLPGATVRLRTATDTHRFTVRSPTATRRALARLVGPG